jgi:hypothetical protein
MNKKMNDKIVDMTEKSISRDYIFDIMKNHIGRDNAISKIDFFEKCYGSIKQYNSFQQLYLWSKIISYLTRIRKSTKCFIVCEKIDIESKFYVLKTKNEADAYIKRSNMKIQGMKQMQARAEKSVKQKWYKKLDMEMIENE